MLWIKVFHILMVIAWLAGLFYLPRILVHYAEGLRLGEDVRRLGIMATRLFRFMTLVAIQAVAAGFWLWLGYGVSGNWLHAKMLFVAALIGYQIVCWFYLQKLLGDDPQMSSGYLRFFNEFPLMLVIPILIFVVVKPF